MNILVYVLIAFLLLLWAFIIVKRFNAWKEVKSVEEEIKKNYQKLVYVWKISEFDKRVGFPKIVRDSLFDIREKHTPGSVKESYSLERRKNAVDKEAKKYIHGNFRRFLSWIFVPIYLLLPIDLRERKTKAKKFHKRVEVLTNHMIKEYWCSLDKTDEEENSFHFRENLGLKTHSKNMRSFKRMILRNYIRWSKAFIANVMKRQEGKSMETSVIGLDYRFFKRAHKSWLRTLAKIEKALDKLDFQKEIREKFIVIYNLSEDKMGEYIVVGDYLGRTVSKIRKIKELRNEIQEILRRQCENKLSFERLFERSETNNLSEETMKIVDLLKESDKSEYSDVLLEGIFDLKSLSLIDEDTFKEIGSILGVSGVVTENLKKMRVLLEEALEILALLVEENFLDESIEAAQPFLDFFGLEEYKLNVRDSTVKAKTRIEAASIQIRNYFDVLDSQKNQLFRLQDQIGVPREEFPELKKVITLITVTAVKKWQSLDAEGLDETLGTAGQKLETMISKNQNLWKWALSIKDLERRLTWLDGKEDLANELYEINLDGHGGRWKEEIESLISKMMSSWASYEENRESNLHNLEGEINFRLDHRKRMLANRLFEIEQRQEFSDGVDGESVKNTRKFRNSLSPDVRSEANVLLESGEGIYGKVPEVILFNRDDVDELYMCFEILKKQQIIHSKQKKAERMERFLEWKEQEARRQEALRNQRGRGRRSHGSLRNAFL